MVSDEWTDEEYRAELAIADGEQRAALLDVVRAEHADGGFVDDRERRLYLDARVEAVEGHGDNRAFVEFMAYPPDETGTRQQGSVT